MSTPVQLYVYDLSNGIARQLSLQLTGRQIDGIWHTSVVVFGKEIFYGQGINITEPGKSHHGSPVRIIDMGNTAIDEDTFNEYISGVREHYTADKYHLLDFNCNSFTNDCLGFLTGGSIPSYIRSLPSDFLSTPFGAAIRPSIDAMFTSRPANGAPVRPMAGPSSAPDPTVAAGLLQNIASQATAGGPSFGGAVSAPAPASAPPLHAMPAPDAPLTAPMHITTNPASFHSLLSSHRAVVAFFTSATCGPCRVIEPVFEELAKTKSNEGVGFAKIDLSVGYGNLLASEYQVRVTPTFLFFLDNKKVQELRGANASELRTQVDLLLFQVFPPHPHTSLSLPAIEAIRLNPILFTQVPNLDIMFNKLAGFIDAVPEWSGTVTQAQVKDALTRIVLPFLKDSTATPPTPQPNATNFDYWLALTSSITTNLGPSELFPLVDIWRLSLLNAPFAAWMATKEVTEGPLNHLIDRVVTAGDVPRSYLLTVLRMSMNAFSNEVLARQVILFARETVTRTRLFLDALQHEDAAVRTAAASVAFNAAVHLQKQRVERVRARDSTVRAEENEDWEIEMVVAVLGAIEAEKNNEEIVHRLVACLGLLLRLSPYIEQMSELLKVLQAGSVLRGKMEKGGCGKKGVVKDDIRKLVMEVAILCGDS